MSKVEIKRFSSFSPLQKRTRRIVGDDPDGKSLRTMKNNEYKNKSSKAGSSTGE